MSINSPSTKAMRKTVTRQRGKRREHDDDLYARAENSRTLRHQPARPEPARHKPPNPRCGCQVKTHALFNPNKLRCRFAVAQRVLHPERLYPSSGLECFLGAPRVQRHWRIREFRGAQVMALDLDSNQGLGVPWETASQECCWCFGRRQLTTCPPASAGSESEFLVVVRECL